jgi:hypothetical protein
VYEDTAETVLCCQASTDPFLQRLVVLICLIYNAFVLGCSLLLAYRIKNIHSSYNETTQLTTVTYFFALASIIWFPLYYSILMVWTPVEEQAANQMASYRTSGVGLSAIATLMVIFVPRVGHALMDSSAECKLSTAPQGDHPDPVAQSQGEHQLQAAKSAQQMGARSRSRVYSPENPFDESGFHPDALKSLGPYNLRF